MKRTVVLGATPNPSRYAYLAGISLLKHGHEIIPVGRHDGDINGVEILDEIPEGAEVDTVTLYLNPTNQQPWLDKLIALKPKRIIFNPGTENPELIRRARENGIQAVIGCTLVMLSARSY